MGLAYTRKAQQLKGSHAWGRPPPVSQKLAEKIGRGEFVEMHKLLPDNWIRMERDGEPSHGSHRHKFLDVRVWAICFASYISVMASRDPRRVQDLLG